MEARIYTRGTMKQMAAARTPDICTRRAWKTSAAGSTAMLTQCVPVANAGGHWRLARNASDEYEGELRPER